MGLSTNLNILRDTTEHHVMMGTPTEDIMEAAQARIAHLEKRAALALKQGRTEDAEALRGRVERMRALIARMG